MQILLDFFFFSSYIHVFQASLIEHAPKAVSVFLPKLLLCHNSFREQHLQSLRLTAETQDEAQFLCLTLKGQGVRSSNRESNIPLLPKSPPESVAHVRSPPFLLQSCCFCSAVYKLSSVPSTQKALCLSVPSITPSVMATVLFPPNAFTSVLSLTWRPCLVSDWLYVTPIV